jgi:hypothetical protein
MPVENMVAADVVPLTQDPPTDIVEHVMSSHDAIEAPAKVILEPAVPSLRLVVETILGATPADWNDEHQKLAANFLENEVGDNKLFAYYATVVAQGATQRKLKMVMGAIPPAKEDWTSVLYFSRDQFNEVTCITAEDFTFRVQFGTIGDNTLDSLLSLMQNLYVPQLGQNKSWPENIRRDFSHQLHRFMAFLTDSVYQRKGLSVLYVPPVRITDPQVSAESKDVVQHCEAALVRTFIYLLFQI